MTTKQVITLLTLLTLLTMSCGRVKKKTKDTINKGGETIGKTASEFIEGVTEGVEQTLQCKLTLSQELQEKGLKAGKFTIQNGPAEGNNNQLTLYLIFDKDFKGTLTAKVVDKNGIEIGRAKLEVEGAAGDSGYFDFDFDKRTYIEVKSVITIE